MKALKGFAKSISFNFNGLDISTANFIEEFEKDKEESYFQSIKKFKKSFRNFESKILNDSPEDQKVVDKHCKKSMIVFIDDLDRCEPEQVLNLMSAIKLFFTLGQKTIFFFGVDKYAVECAVKTKYGDVIKSDEYLEKIIDISFSMPLENDIFKLINVYFDNTEYYLSGYDNSTNSSSISLLIKSFFHSMNFNNPRKVKKVLNKYQILRELINSQALNNSSPNIDLKNNNQASLLETVLILYLIILKEFYPVEFINIFDFDTFRNKFRDSEFASLMNNNVNYKLLNSLDFGVSVSRNFNSFLVWFDSREYKSNRNSEIINLDSVGVKFYFYLGEMVKKGLLNGSNAHSSNNNLYTLKQLIQNSL